LWLADNLGLTTRGDFLPASLILGLFAEPGFAVALDWVFIDAAAGKWARLVTVQSKCQCCKIAGTGNIVNEKYVWNAWKRGIQVKN
jgi:hypothetical protein